MNKHKKPDNPRARKSWASAMLRSPWTVLCAAASVVVGPAAVTASALDRANAAPPHHIAAPRATGTPDAAEWGRAAA